VSSNAPWKQYKILVLEKNNNVPYYDNCLRKQIKFVTVKDTHVKSQQKMYLYLVQMVKLYCI
jgi:hypothetical protein